MQLTQQEVTNERASSDHRKHTSGGVFIAADSNLGRSGEREGAVASIAGNKGKITELGKCAGHASVFGVLLALGRMDPEERSLAGGSVEASQSYQTSVAGGM